MVTCNEKILREFSHLDGDMYFVFTGTTDHIFISDLWYV